MSTKKNASTPSSRQEKKLARQQKKADRQAAKIAKREKLGFFGKIGVFGLGILKVVGIVMIVGTILSATLLPISLAIHNNGNDSEIYTITSFDVKKNQVILENSEGTMGFQLMGVRLDKSLENDAEGFEKYIGTQVTIKNDNAFGKYTKADVRWGYLCVVGTSRVIQMDLLCDKLVTMDDNFPTSASMYDEFLEAARFGRYPD